MFDYSQLTEPIYLNLTLSAILGSIIGLERELAGKDASLRTFMIICLGSCLFTQASTIMAGTANGDPSRIAAQIVTGIGFLGAGAIFKSNFGIEGLTTAALIWLTAAVGVMCGLHQITLACFSTGLAVIFMILLNFVHDLIRRLRPDYYTDTDEL